MKEIILYPGSFSPLHVGHLCLANYLIETVEADELWFLLTPSNPFKDPRVLLPEDFRAEWAREVLDRHPRMKLSTAEFGLPKPNYTHNTLAHLRRTHPECHFTLLIGTDSLIDLPRWYRGEELVREESFLVYPRPGFATPEWARERPNIRLLGDEVPTFEISSTEIRALLARGCRLPYFLALPSDHPLYKRLLRLLAAAPDKFEPQGS